MELFDPADFNIGRAAPLDISLSGPSNVFVSHAWTGNFLRLCESVEAAGAPMNEFLLMHRRLAMHLRRYSVVLGNVGHRVE